MCSPSGLTFRGGSALADVYYIAAISDALQDVLEYGSGNIAHIRRSDAGRATLLADQLEQVAFGINLRGHDPARFGIKVDDPAGRIAAARCARSQAELRRQGWRGGCLVAAAGAPWTIDASHDDGLHCLTSPKAEHHKKAVRGNTPEDRTGHGIHLKGRLGGNSADDELRPGSDKMIESSPVNK